MVVCVSIAAVAANSQSTNSNTQPAKKNNYPQNSTPHVNPAKTNGKENTRPAATTTSNTKTSATTGSNNSSRSALPPVSQTSPVSNVQGRSSTNTKKSTFVGGVYAGSNAAQTFDTTNPAINSNPNSIVNDTRVGTSIAGANDTTFNVNTISAQNGNNTSGAVDRSGQSQFGQTNWGRSERNTVGESQWTIPPPITASFNKDFPAANSAAWTRNNVDTNMYAVRYRSGATWITSTYNAAGNRVDTRTEISLVNAPRPVSVFLEKQPSTFKLISISKLQIQGRPEVYELRLTNGKTAYVNNDGIEVNL